MVIEISEHDFRQIEDAVGKIKAAVVTIRMGNDRERSDALQDINYEANSIATLLHNGVIADEAEVEARR